MWARKAMDFGIDYLDGEVHPHDSKEVAELEEALEAKLKRQASG